MGFNLDDYVDVAERIATFREKCPEGSLQAEVIRWPEDGFGFVAVKARAYRTPDDPRPGCGLAWENFPGLTPYTKNSELQNAETSAWGRAIVAVLAADTKKGVASAQEVRRGRDSGAAQTEAGRGTQGAGASPAHERPAAPETSERTEPASDDTGKEEPRSEPVGEGDPQGETPSSATTEGGVSPPATIAGLKSAYGGTVAATRAAWDAYEKPLVELKDEEIADLIARAS